MNAIILTRVSSAEQARGWSLETQRDRCREYAAAHGLAVVAEYADVETGATTERAGFQQAMADIRAGRAEALIVYQTDRLHRDLPHAMLTRRELQRLGIELHTVKRGKSGDAPEEQFADNIDDLLAELERARISERTSRGKRAKMQAGIVLGAGPAPYGYTYEGRGADRHLVIDEEIAPIVRQIFAWYAAGDGVVSIADRLTERGYPSPADVRADGRSKWGKIRPYGTWTINHIYPLLAQTAYSGTYTLYRTRRITKTRSARTKPEHQYHVPVPAIVDAETWRAAQERRARGQSESRGHQVHDYLVGRRIECTCGYKAHGRSTSMSGKHKELRLWYVCNGRVRRLTAKECSAEMPWFRAERVDAAVWEYLVTLLSSPERLEDRITRGRRAAERATQPSADRTDLLARKAKAERANARMLDLYEAEEIDRQEWRKRKTANDNEIASIDRQIAELDTPPAEAPPPIEARMADAVRALASEVQARRDALPYEGRRRVVEALNVYVTLLYEGGAKSLRVASILGVDVLAVS